MPTKDKPKDPETRERRALGGALVRISARPGAIYGQLKRDGRRVQKLLISAAEGERLRKAKENVDQIAERRLAEWVLEIDDATPGDGSLRQVTVTEFLPEFIATIEKRVVPTHSEDVKAKCERFAAFVGSRAIADIGPDVVQDYLAKLARGRGQARKVDARRKDGSVVRDENGKAKKVVVHDDFSPFTARNHRSALSLLWKCAIDRRAARTNIWTGNAAKIARGQQFVPVNLTAAEVKSILAHVSEPVRPILTFCADTGVRLNEARALTWPHVEKDYSNFTIARAKTGRARTLPTTENVKAILKERWEARASKADHHADKRVGARSAKRPSRGRGEADAASPGVGDGHADGGASKVRAQDLVFENYGRSRIYVCFKKAVDKAGVDPRARVHDLRHHVGSALASANAPIDVIMAALGHSQLSTVQRYLHHGADALTEAFRAVEAAKAKAPAATTDEKKSG